MYSIHRRWDSLSTNQQEAYVNDRVNMRWYVMLGAMALVMGITLGLFGAVLWMAIDTWFNYYIVYFYTPVFFIYLCLALLAMLRLNAVWLIDLNGPGIFAIFNPLYYGLFATWNQWTGWMFLILLVLNIRPIYIWGEVSGWRVTGSPCGWSSCSRNHSALFDGVYNPNGWFPHGDDAEYDTNHLDRYTFCNYRGSCRWCDTTLERIQGYSLWLQNSLLNFDDPVDPDDPLLQGGYASQRPQDYPCGKGLAFGWRPAQRVNEVALCPGNMLTTGNITIDGESVTIYGLGREICSVCHLYEEDMAGPGSENDRSLNQCAANSDGSINMFCGFCPGEAGHFGSPFDSHDHETIDASEIEDTAIWCMVLGITPLIHLFIIYAAGTCLRLNVGRLSPKVL